MAAVQSGTFAINSARRTEAMKGAEGAPKYSTGPGDAMRGGRDAEGTVTGEG